MKLQRIISAFLLSVALLLLLASCGIGGALLTELPLGDGRTVEAYGGEVYGVKNLVVRNADGSEAQRLHCTNRVTRPFHKDDGLDYGVSVVDIDADGLPDIISMSERTFDGDTYNCFRADGSGGFYLDETLSAIRGIHFGDNGEVSSLTRVRTDLPSSPNEPKKYIFAVTITYLAPDTGKNGRYTVVREEALTYYSETEIYCYAVSEPDESGDMETTSEKWILPDKLAEAGLDGFGKEYGY